MKIVASLDIGSNSILLLVAKITKNNIIFPIIEESRTPRLAQGMKKTGKISGQSLKKAIRDINYLKNIARQFGAEEIFAVATQAVRSAKNKSEVVRQIKRQTGIKIEIISGRKEAEITYLGSVTGMPGLRADRIVCDIGGASSEFVWAENNQIRDAISLKIGAVEITERFRTDLKKATGELGEISHELDLFFKNKLINIDSKGSALIGSGGTITTYKMLDIGLKQYSPADIHGWPLKKTRLDELLFTMANMKLSERKRFIIFEPRRAEIIIAGGLILSSLLRHFQKHSIKVSTRSLRWGFLKSKL